MVHESIENRCLAYVSLRIADGNQDGFHDLLSSYPGVLNVLPDDTHRVVAVVAANHRSGLAEIVGGVMAFAKSLGGSFQSLIVRG
jgi:hypothetical protein